MVRLSCSFVALLVALAVWSGCATYAHVELPKAPTAQEPYETRADYFKKHAPSDYDGASVLLRGGERVYYPEDLLPAVGDDSVTAKAIHKQVDARARLDAAAPYVTAPGLVAMLGGLGAVVASPIVSSSSSDLFLPMLIGGAAVSCAGGVWLMVGTDVLAGDASRVLGESTQLVLRSYEQSLSDRVAIHPNADGTLVDKAPGGLQTGSQEPNTKTSEL